MKIKPNPRHEAFLAQLKTLKRPFFGWEGIAFRAAPLPHANAVKLLDGKGSLKTGGRWSAAGTFPAVNLSTSQETAVRESSARKNDNAQVHVFMLAQNLVRWQVTSMKKMLIHASAAVDARKDNGQGIAVRSKAVEFLSTLRKDGVQTGSAVKQFCDAYGVTQETFTRLTGFSQRAVANWRQGQKPSASTERRLAELKRLFAALAQLVATEAIGPWLKQPNPAFDGSTPFQVIERGEADRLWRMIYELETGEPG